jgi:hypothetical protein
VLKDLVQVLTEFQDCEEWWDCAGKHAVQLLDQLSEAEWRELRALCNAKDCGWHMNLIDVLDCSRNKEVIPLLNQLIEGSAIGTAKTEVAEYAWLSLGLESLQKYRRQHGTSSLGRTYGLARELLRAGHQTEALEFGELALFRDERKHGRHHAMTRLSAGLVAHILECLGRAKEATAVRADFHTGPAALPVDLLEKRFGLLHQMVPSAKKIAMLFNPWSPYFWAEQDVRYATDVLGLRVVVLMSVSNTEIDEAIDTIVSRRSDALMLSADPFFFEVQDHIISLTTRHEIPTMFFFGSAVSAGGLLSYGPENPVSWVRQPGKFALNINSRAAASLGLSTPQELAAIADRMVD